MNKTIQESAAVNAAFECDFIDLSTAGNIASLQKQSASKYLLTVKIMSRVFFKLLTNKYDAVYITPFPFGFAFIKDSLVILLSRLFGHKPFLHLHTYGFKKAARRSSFWNNYYRFVFKNTKAICLSDLLVEDIEELYTGPVSILPNGMARINFENTYTATQEPVTLLYLSNLIKGKGILVLIDAIALVKKHGHAFHLRVVGSEHDITYAMLKELIAKKQLENEVSLIGPKYGTKKHDEFRNAGIFLLPSNYDTFGLVLLEAMQFGVPCISTNIGGIPDVLGNGRGMLINEITPEALAAAIEYLLLHPAERQQMGKAGFDYYDSHFTKEIFEARLVSVLNETPQHPNTRLVKN